MTELDKTTGLPVWMTELDFCKNGTYFLEYLDEFGSSNLDDWVSKEDGITGHHFRNELVSRGLNEPKSVPPQDANLVSSRIALETGFWNSYPTMHRPLLDLDIPAYLVPSKTPEHSHLYLDVQMSEEQYGKLLNVLVEVGIINPGVLDLQWNRYRATFLRLPSKRTEPYKMPDEARERIIDELAMGHRVRSAVAKAGKAVKDESDPSKRNKLIDELQKQLDSLRLKEEDLIEFDEEPPF